jgi:hypothetical protein
MIDARSIYDSSNIDDQNLFTTLANYRHRFERSMNFKKLRWAFSALNSTAICDACDLLVPEVILSFQSIYCTKNVCILDAGIDCNQSIRFN